MLAWQRLEKRIGFWWLSQNSHSFNGNAQLECSRDGMTLNIPDLTRVVHDPSSLVVFLMETKNKRETLERFRRKLHFFGYCYVNPVGLSRGLTLWWKDNVEIDVRYKSKNLLRCIVS
ncbi:hypothetical protein Vadar_021104 [Vaccinium darrowii]|uniref:Uncharacterized protein n=1 Tax=Vaccinium darrowii TaxID=229202 RepID=A0ACB7Y1Y1_9ERIC|nr:hypothetical protein Vadar_021104 [Vaccinium darrowii]